MHRNRRPNRVALIIWQFGMAYAAAVGVWEARASIALAALAGGVAAVLVGIVILRAEGSR